MRTQIKSILTTAAVVCMVVIGLGLSAATILDNGKKEVKSAKLVPPTDGWYEVTITPLSDPDQESNQNIGSLTDEPPLDDSFGCAIHNTGDVCRVYLTFDPAATIVPATIAAANAPGSFTNAGDQAKHP